jgi:hypothetical protein
MMRVFWDEWRGGLLVSVRRVFPLLALAVLLALMAAGFQTGMLLEVAALGLLGAGYASGTQYWNREPSWDWRDRGLSPTAYAVGKVAGLLAVTALWLVFLSPVAVLLALGWGLPTVAWSGAAWAVAGGLAAQALGRAGAWSGRLTSRSAAGLATCAWVTLGLVWEPAQRFNPLWQIYRMQQRPQEDLDPVSLLLLLAGVALVWAAVGLVERARRP